MKTTFIVIQVEGTADCFTVPTLDSASIIIITKGAGKFLASNQVGGLVTKQASNQVGWRVTRKAG